MKPEELRIGNYLYTKLGGGEWRKCNIDVEDLRFVSMPKQKVYKPIPLTEQWLLDFGFDKNERTYTHWPCIIWKVDGGWMYLNVMFFNDRNGDPRGGYHVILEIYNNNGNLSNSINMHRDFYNVHQLQNLYYALTGKELTK